MSDDASQIQKYATLHRLLGGYTCANRHVWDWSGFLQSQSIHHGCRAIFFSHLFSLVCFGPHCPAKHIHIGPSWPHLACQGAISYGIDTNLLTRFQSIAKPRNHPIPSTRTKRRVGFGRLEEHVRPRNISDSPYARVSFASQTSIVILEQTQNIGKSSLTI